MPCCVAVNCTNRSEKGVRLFKFPADIQRRSIWLQNMRRGGNWKPTRSSCLCEKHFEASQFESHRKDGWKKLKPNSIPTLFDVPNPPPMIDPPSRKSKYKKAPDTTSMCRNVTTKSGNTVPSNANNSVIICTDIHVLQENEPNLESTLSHNVPSASKDHEEYNMTAGVMLRFTEICRLCLHSNSQLLPLFDREKKLPEKLASILPTLMVNAEDGLPSQVCQNCVQQLNDSYEFKLKCEHSNSLLRQYLECQQIPQIQLEQEKSDDEQKDESLLHQIVDELSNSSGKTNFDTDVNCEKSISKEKNDEHVCHKCKCTFKSAASLKEHDVCHMRKEDGNAIVRLDNSNTCPKCGKSFSSKFILTEHLSLHSSAQAHSCPQCGKTFKYRSNLLEHQAIHYHQCSFCEKMFSSQQDMVTHVTSLHSQEAPYFCQQCYICFREEVALLEHKKEHFTEKKLVCGTCGKSFTTDHNLKAHEHLHSNSRIYACLHCKKNFEFKADLLKHTSESHRTEESCDIEEKNANNVEMQEETSVYNCEECNRTFLAHAEYVSHITNHSNEITHQRSVGKCFKHKSKMCSNKPPHHVYKDESDGPELTITQNGQYSCEYCDKSFTCRSKYFAHAISHSDARPFECAICGKKFKYQSNLSNHKALHVKAGPYLCLHCGRSFGNQSHLTKHAASHSEERPHQCSVCGKCFKHKSNLCNHKALHVENGPHLCTHCGKSFATKSILARHVAMHSGERPYCCPYCGKGFKHMSNMCNHKALHLQKSPFLCAVCGKAFSSRSNLTTHSAAHSDDRRHQCNICGKAFKFRSSLNSHVSLHSMDRPHVCKICGRSFRCRSTFVNHVRAHTGEKPHSCGICSKDFTTLSNLIVHRRVHSGEKPYTCLECGKAFSDRGNLSAHQAVHTPDRPHACPTCRQTFKYPSSMKRHIRKRHGGIGLPPPAQKLVSVEKY